MHLILHIDGGARGNPGPAGVGVVITAKDDGTALVRRGFYLGHATNNVAEYTGLLRGLELVAAWKPTDVEIVSDSELLVKQIKGQYRVKAEHLKPLFEQAHRKLAALPRWSIRHVLRGDNQEADGLANRAMDRKQDVDLDAE
jgi:probable phosphoglycerate mutase